MSQKTTSKLWARGQRHPRAVLTDHEVELIRQLHERDGWGYNRISKVFGVPKRTVRDWLTYKFR